MKKLHLYIDEELKKCKNKTDTEIVKAIADAFDRLETEWVQIANTSFQNGFPKAALVGSCALVSIAYNNKLYVSNAGDSKAVLLRLSDDGASF
jgi:serine/threonine protein phosphatase PrpC